MKSSAFKQKQPDASRAILKVPPNNDKRFNAKGETLVPIKLAIIYTYVVSEAGVFLIWKDGQIEWNIQYWIF